MKATSRTKMVNDVEASLTYGTWANALKVLMLHGSPTLCRKDDGGWKELLPCFYCGKVWNRMGVTNAGLMPSCSLRTFCWVQIPVPRGPRWTIRGSDAAAKPCICQGKDPAGAPSPRGRRGAGKRPMGGGGHARAIHVRPRAGLLLRETCAVAVCPVDMYI